MSNLADIIYPPLPDAAALVPMHEHASALTDIYQQFRSLDLSSVTEWAEQVRQERAFLDAAASSWKAALLAFHAGEEMFRVEEQLRTSGIWQHAQDAAKLAQTFALRPGTLELLKLPHELMSVEWTRLQTAEWMARPEYTSAFSSTSAIADLIAKSVRVDQEMREATLAFANTAIPNFDTLTDYRYFLDAAGLTLPRWPRIRLLTAAEKRRRFKARLKKYAEPTHVRRAKSLVHRYEQTLRDIIDGVMAATYGEDWPEMRLPLCGCNDLLGRWRRRGGEVLDHADYAHYRRIMCHPEHFAEAFEAGFDDPDELACLMKEAGRLRATSHHARTFTPEDLRALRLTWRTVETGLLAFTPDVALEEWD